MIDIERKSLEFLLKNLNTLERLFNTSYVECQIFNPITHINEWSYLLKVKYYEKIIIYIFKYCDINYIVEKLRSLDFHNENINICLFNAVIIDFLSYLEKYYELYLLDNILYLLTKCRYFSYADTYFGLGYEEISLYEESSLSREKEIYNIKKFYLNELKKIEFEQKEKLISDLENKDDFFSVQLIRLLKEIINLEDKVIRVRRKKEIKNQLSLF